MSKKLAVVALLCTVLTACGGSGDDDTPVPEPTPQASPEGFWVGHASTGTDVFVAVLEDGQSWGIYASGGYIVGALTGTTSFRGDQLSGSGRDFNLPARSVSDASYAGTFSARNQIDVRLSNGSTFTGRYDDSYDQPASLATLVGFFSGEGVTGTTFPQAYGVSIGVDGLITLPSTQGCGGAGWVLPRASGKNVYDVTITFQGSTCALGHGTTVRGIAVYDTAQRSLWALALNSAKSDGFIYVARKD
ncbi:hypothetical protein H0I39_10730 [Ottowia beijingensis]|uniref:Uncharacterized protein n=1 Tax=Ottowia beijingensis TaxID=1207057 RepID=A0A853INS6_9BURK|nr:hypothetical protein [Ottowia beijingensis]NZA02106.1 hypothetical protein [Ottowia beijingensis]